MNALDLIEKKDLKELISKNWMTHDAMWFYHTYVESGIEMANRINRAAIGSLSAIEVKRLLKTMEMKKESIKNFDDLKCFIDASFQVMIPEFMRFTYACSKENVMTWEWQKGKCFAYEGIKGIGELGRYQCGVMYRIECWFDSLGIPYTVSPKIEKCLMHTQGSCTGEFRFNFPA